MTLIELMQILANLNPDTQIVSLEEPHSYRGYYDCIAFEFGDKKRAADVLADVTKCVGMTFEGWKGGEFTMGLNTPVFIANLGSTGRALTGFGWTTAEDFRY